MKSTNALQDIFGEDVNYKSDLRISISPNEMPFFGLKDKDKQLDKLIDRFIEKAQCLPKIELHYHTESAYCIMIQFIPIIPLQ